MEILNRYNVSGDTICIMRFTDMEEMIILHRALRYLKILNGGKEGEKLNDMLTRMDKWHRVYNQKRYKDLLVFS